MSKKYGKWSILNHIGFIFFIRFSTKHLFAFIFIETFVEQKSQHSFENIEASSFFFKEERDFKPNIIILIVITLFTKPSRDLYSVSHVHFLFCQLNNKYIFALVLVFVYDLSHRFSSSSVDALTHAD